MDTIIFVKAWINSVPVQATMRVPVPHVSDRELRIRLFWHLYELQQETLDALEPGAEGQAA